MSLQLYHWPWKAPILNFVDFLSCFLITISVVVTGFYIPGVTGGLQETFALLRALPFCFMILLTRLLVLSPVYFPGWGQFVGHLWLAMVRHPRAHPFVHGRGPHGGLVIPCFVLPCLVLSMQNGQPHMKVLTPTAFQHLLSATCVTSQWFCINDSVTQCITSYLISRVGYVQVCVIHKDLVWADLGAAIGSNKDGLQVPSWHNVVQIPYQVLLILASIRVALSKLLAISAAFDVNQELTIMTAGKTPPPSAVSDNLFDVLQKFSPVSKEEWRSWPDQSRCFFFSLPLRMRDGVQNGEYTGRTKVVLVESSCCKPFPLEFFCQHGLINLLN